MSVTVYVMARKRISSDEQALITAYNTMADNCIDAPDAMKKLLLSIVGNKPDEGWGEPYNIDYAGFVEIHVDGQGDVMTYDGKLLRFENLPAGTEELRIYAS